MRNENSKFISFRCGVIFFIMALQVLSLLIILSVIAICEKKYGLLLAAGYIVYVLILYGAHVWIYKPFQETAKVLRLFTEGSILEGVFELRSPLSKGMDSAVNRFKMMIDTKELISISKKQAEYLALQNQINPHFLYNTLEGIRSEALCAGMDGVADMTEALGTFFRYTISKVDNLVTLEDELNNISNYYHIQQYRFGDRLNVSVEFGNDDEREVLMLRLPKLTLQPIVENSIYHGIERKMGKGNLRIKVQTTADRLIITISDDGLGMEKELLDQLNKKLRSTSLDDVVPLKKEKQGGIAVINVNNRIKLLFGDRYGVYIYSTPGVGTDVTITLPKAT